MHCTLILYLVEIYIFEVFMNGLYSIGIFYLYFYFLCYPTDLEYMRVYDAHYLSTDSNATPEISAPGYTIYGVNDLVQHVNSLHAHAGGDCPEYGMIAISTIIDLISSVQSSEVDIQEESHNIIVLTDASAKDDSLYTSVISKASELDVAVHFFYSGGGCSGFGHYDNVAESTDGLTVSQIDASSFSTFVQYIQYAQENEGTARNFR